LGRAGQKGELPGKGEAGMTQHNSSCDYRRRQSWCNRKKDNEEVHRGKRTQGGRMGGKKSSKVSRKNRGFSNKTEMVGSFLPKNILGET